VLVLSSSLLAGCGGGAAEQAASSTGSAVEEGAASPARDEVGDGVGEAATTSPSSFPANAEPDTADASPDARVTVSGIRVAAHDGFDRVVFEAGGTGTPGWDVRYVDRASSQGSGEPIDVAGTAVLQVTLTGAGYPYDTGVDEYSGADPLSASGTRSVTEVAFDGTFEGTTVSFVGTSGKLPFRVYLLDNPVRVVVEVAHAG
jgi:hypothetical protein